MSNPILLAPGPVQLHPEVLRILAEPMIHHRTAEFDHIFLEALQGLKFLFQTIEPVFIHTSAGSGAMESSLINILSPGDHVLAIVSGKFGERWAEMAEVFGADVHRMNIKWGHAVNPEDVRQYLIKNPHTQIVMTQACETSTGTAHPIFELGKIIAETKALFLVDGITAVGAFPIPMDAWKIDGLIAGSQKGIMLPTGLSFVSYSKKAWVKAETATSPRYYFDLRRELKANKNNESLFSASVPLIKALNFILKTIQKNGLDSHFHEIRRRADFTRTIGKKMGLTLFSNSASDSVTAFNLPSVITKGVEFRAHFEKKYDVVVMGGQDQAKGKIVRIGHMGFISDKDLTDCMTRLAHALTDFGYKVDASIIELDCKNWLKANPL